MKRNLLFAVTLLMFLSYGCRPSNDETDASNPPVAKKVIYADDGSKRVMEEYSVLESDTTVKHGVYKYFFENGAVSDEVNYVNGKMEGEKKFYYLDGSTQVIETYKNGEYHGPYISYYDNGQLREEGQYKDGSMSGLWKFYTKRGRLTEEITFDKNGENGPARIYHPNGALAEEGNYISEEEEVEPLKTGVWTEYHMNGQVMIVETYKPLFDQGRDIIVGQTYMMNENGDTTTSILYDEEGMTIEVKELIPTPAPPAPPN